MAAIKTNKTRRYFVLIIKDYLGLEINKDLSRRFCYLSSIIAIAHLTFLVAKINKDLVINIKNKNYLLSDKFYDEIAPLYDTYFSSKKMIEQQSSLIKKVFKKRGLVLDIGCGSGGLALSLAQHEFGVIGLDKSSEMLKEFKKKLSGKNFELPLIRGDVTKSPLIDNSFEYATCMFGVVNHLDRKSLISMLKEIKRVLKPDGLIILNFAEPSHIRKIWNLERYNKNSFIGTFKVDEKIIKTLIWLYESKDIVRMAKAVQLKVERILSSYSLTEGEDSIHRIVILKKIK